MIKQIIKAPVTLVFFVCVCCVCVCVCVLFVFVNVFFFVKMAHDVQNSYYNSLHLNLLKLLLNSYRMSLFQNSEMLLLQVL